MIRHATEHWMNFSRESLKLMVIYSFRSDKIDGLCYSTQYMFPFKGFITQRFSGVRCGDMLSTRQFNPPLTSLNLSYPLLHFFFYTAHHRCFVSPTSLSQDSFLSMTFWHFYPKRSFPAIVPYIDLMPKNFLHGENMKVHSTDENSLLCHISCLNNLISSTAKDYATKPFPFPIDCFQTSGSVVRA